MCVFLHVCNCASSHLLQTGHNISMIYFTTVHEISTRCRGYILGLCVGIGFAISFPTVVNCQQKQWRRLYQVVGCCRRFAPQNWLLWQMAGGLNYCFAMRHRRWRGNVPSFSLSSGFTKKERARLSNWCRKDIGWRNNVAAVTSPDQSGSLLTVFHREDDRWTASSIARAYIR